MERLIKLCFLICVLFGAETILIILVELRALFLPLFP